MSTNQLIQFCCVMMYVFFERWAVGFALKIIALYLFGKDLVSFLFLPLLSQWSINESYSSKVLRNQEKEQYLRSPRPSFCTPFHKGKSWSDACNSGLWITTTEHTICDPGKISTCALSAEAIDSKNIFSYRIKMRKNRPIGEKTIKQTSKENQKQKTTTLKVLIFLI